MAMTGCGGDDAPTATAETARLAAIDAQHLCNVAETSYATEDAIKAGLVELLEVEGLEYDDWKQWHDSLIDSPDRAEQLAVETAKACP